MLTADQMERVIRRYYDGCNEADVAKMAGCFTLDAVHYFPPGMPGATIPWRAYHRRELEAGGAEGPRTLDHRRACCWIPRRGAQ